MYYIFLIFTAESLTNVCKAGENCNEYKNDKVFKVFVSPTHFKLSEKASSVFMKTHHDFEKLAEKYENNNFLSGIHLLLCKFDCPKM